MEKGNRFVQIPGIDLPSFRDAQDRRVKRFTEKWPQLSRIPDDTPAQRIGKLIGASMVANMVGIRQLASRCNVSEDKVYDLLAGGMGADNMLELREEILSTTRVDIKKELAKSIKRGL